MDYKELAIKAKVILDYVAQSSEMADRAIVNRIREFMAEWEIAHGPVDEFPLPDWAESYNEGRALVVRAQLCTKDGRRVGNARILEIKERWPDQTPGMLYYRCRTDIGSEFWYTEQELYGAFNVGNYIMKPNE